MARRAVCGLWPDCDPCMYENGDWILILHPPTADSPTVGGDGPDRTRCEQRCFMAQVANNSLTIMQDSVFYQSDYSPALLLSFGGT